MKTPGDPPTVGALVHYRPDTKSAPLVPAVVVATIASARAYPSQESPEPEPGCVHLVQLSPSPSQQLGGTYGARDVPEDETDDTGEAYAAGEHTPGTWRWPNGKL